MSHEPKGLRAETLNHLLVFPVERTADHSYTTGATQRPDWLPKRAQRKQPVIAETGLAVDRNDIHVALQRMALKPVIENENLRAESSSRADSDVETIAPDENRDPWRLRGENHCRGSRNFDATLDKMAIRDHEHRITPVARATRPARRQRNTMAAAVQGIRNPGGGRTHTCAARYEAAHTDDTYWKCSPTQRSMRVKSAVQQDSRTEEPGCGSQRESSRCPPTRFFALVEPHCPIPQRSALFAAGAIAVTAGDRHA
jgi:hypothetical protein